jgi:hypothetical protein
LADADAIWSGKRLQSCCNIDTIAKNLIAIDYDISHINADAELHFLCFGHGGIAFPHPALKLDPAAQGVHHARELHEHAVASRIDEPTPVLGDLEIYEGAAVGLELRDGAFLVDAHEAAVASHIGCQNGREPSLYAFAGQAALRDQSKTVYACRGQDSMGAVTGWGLLLDGGRYSMGPVLLPWERYGVRYPKSELSLYGGGRSTEHGADDENAFFGDRRMSGLFAFKQRASAKNKV